MSSQTWSAQPPSCVRWVERPTPSGCRSSAAITRTYSHHLTRDRGSRDVIDLTREEPVPLAQVPKLRCVPRRPGGKTIHLATVHRWATNGIGGVVLETIRCGGTKCTTVAAIQRFFARLSEQSKPTGQPIRTRRQQRHAVAQAEAELDRAGIGCSTAHRQRRRARPQVGALHLPPPRDRF